MHWSADYLGITWEVGGRTRAGLDCWGVPVLVFRDRLGIKLHDYDGAYSDIDKLKEIDGLFRTEFQDWPEIPAGAEREYDLVTFARHGFETHVGIVTFPGVMLHIDRGFKNKAVDGKREVVNEGYDRSAVSRFIRHPRLVLC